jgi:hypothetical protein
MSGFRITRRTLPFKVGTPAGFTFISDTHIGGSVTDHDAILADLEDARSHGDRVNVNGDIFDVILPKDHKRYKPDALAPRLQGRANVLNAALDYACEIFGPHAKIIDMMGCGNHEASVEKFHGLDVLSLLIHRLNTEYGGEISYGGYSGFLDYRFRATSGGVGNRVVIYYHHGGGGAAPVTKGMIDFNRKAAWVDSDVVWLGHKHNRLVDSTPLRMRCPQSGDSPKLDQQVFIMSGSYLDTVSGQTHEQAMVGGRRGNYAADWGLPPQAKGGIRLEVKFHRKCGIERMRTIL